jgi:hypothetical protein
LVVEVEVEVADLVEVEISVEEGAGVVSGWEDTVTEVVSTALEVSDALEVSASLEAALEAALEAELLEAALEVAAALLEAAELEAAALPSTGNCLEKLWLVSGSLSLLSTMRKA